MSIPGGEPDPVPLSPNKLAERRPYRECRKKAVSYKDLSSESEDDFHDVDSSLNQTLEPENIEDEKKVLKNKNFPEKLSDITKELEGCQLDGSAIVYDDSEEEVVGLVVGAGTTDNKAEAGALGEYRMANDEIINFED